MQILENIPLKTFNSFGINVTAKRFAGFSNVDELAAICNLAGTHNPLIIGGGSNILLTGDPSRLVLHNEMKGISVVRETDEMVLVKVGAGVNWHVFVEFCIAQGFGGVENLALIPGNVGASPMQNIGAYGVEIKDVFEELTAWHIADAQTATFDRGQCAFGYRESVFKQKLRGQYVILDVTFRLQKHPVFNTSYGAIESELEKMGIQVLTIRAIADAVINIRRSKLPDPAVIGNAGSFFKNPSVSHTVFDSLKKQFEGMPGYDNPDGTVKLAAGWMIEQCGWKGFRRGDAGCHAKQALVLVNYGNASGAEILELSEEIITSVKKQFHIDLEREVNVI